MTEEAVEVVTETPHPLTEAVTRWIRRLGGSISEDAVRGTVLVIVMLLLVSVQYLLADATVRGVPLWLFHQRLYMIPVAYAALCYGRRGGLLTALAAAAIITAHARFGLSQPVLLGFDTWLEIGTIFALGGILGAMRDTERRRTGDLVALSRELEGAYGQLEERATQLINIQDYTQSILRSIPTAVLTVGPDGSVATANASAEAMLGFSEFEMVPKPIESLFRDDGGIGGDVARVLSGDAPRAFREASIETTDGRELRVQATTSRMMAVHGESLGAVVTIEDLSEVRALTDQLIRADRLAAMGQLTAGLAHEVRNPLGVIRATVQLLEDARGDAARTSYAAGVIKQEIDRLDRVIKALLDFGRPSKPMLLKTDVRDVLSDVVLFTTRFGRQFGVEIVLNLAEEPLFVRGDADQLKQVFLNLITNAVQAMENTGGTITVTARRERYFIEVSIADNGPGISEDNLPRVFDPFFTTHAEGTGLGLTIVHRIIDDHGGHIEVESGKRGTTFRIRLPMVSGKEENA
ncbi:MAG: nitrogen regulation protein NR(II) [Coriobacteriia bacterium]